MKAGQNYGIRPAGYHALRWLRTEKFYSYWGVDFNSEHTPFEIGREMRVKFNKVRLAIFNSLISMKACIFIFHYVRQN